MHLKKLIKKKIIDPLSISAVKKMVHADPDLKEVWELSLDLLPDLKEHFTIPVDDLEVEYRIRLLICAEVIFVKDQIEQILAGRDKCSFADVGDSDGSVRFILEKMLANKSLKTVGINLQPSAVEKMKERGLSAICADALKLADQGHQYDLVSVFETLEHLPDPIGFLSGIRKVTGEHLIVSVPYIRNSRVGMGYQAKNWPVGKKPTIENTHIFELSPTDWHKIFRHTGWEVEREKKLLMYPVFGLQRLLLQPFWRMVSFEGFWFVSLKKDDTFASTYEIE